MPTEWEQDRDRIDARREEYNRAIDRAEASVNGSSKDDVQVQAAYENWQAALRVEKRHRAARERRQNEESSRAEHERERRFGGRGAVPDEHGEHHHTHVHRRGHHDLGTCNGECRASLHEHGHSARSYAEAHPSERR